MENIAVFIDLNKTDFSFETFEDILMKLQQRGRIIYGKLYNFSSSKHREFLSLVRQLDFETAPQGEATLRKRNKDILDVRQVIDVMTFINGETKIDTIFIITGKGNVVPLLKSVKMQNIYIIGAFDYTDTASVAMCNENFAYNFVTILPDTLKKTSSKAKTASKKKPKTKKKAVKKKTVKKRTPRPVSKPKIEDIDLDTPKAFEEKANIIGEDHEEQFFIQVLEDFANRTKELNFEFNEDLEEKQQLLSDIENFVKKQKAIQSDKDEINPEIMAVLRELGNLAVDIRTTMDLDQDDDDGNLDY